MTARDLQDFDARQTGWVSPWSRWSDPTWYFSDPARSKERRSSAVWDFEALPGEYFDEPKFEDLCESAKIVIYCLHMFPALRIKLKAETVNEVSIGIRYFLRWFLMSGRISLDQVDSVALAEFEDYLIQDKINDDLDDGLSTSSIARYVRGPLALWEEGQRINLAGLPIVPQLPWAGEGAHVIGRRLAMKALGKIKPIPSEILVPLMNRAQWFLEGPASDIVKMARTFTEELPKARSFARDSRSAHAHIGKYVASSIAFSRFEEEAPWHGPLNDGSERIGSKSLEVKRSNSIELGFDLCGDVMAAAAILLQGGAGLRVSEIENLEATGLDERTGFPDCIDVRVDDTSTIELFYVKGYLVKTTGVREPADWLIGARVVGANHLPPPVLALCRVYDLSRLLAKQTTSKRLFVGSAGGSWSYFLGKATPLDGSKINRLQRAFAATWVDRTLVEQVELLRTHGWRKSFAQFISRVDPSLGPGLSQHYKHLSLAVTDEAYFTNDPSLRGFLDSERAMETARDLYEISTGKVAASGRLGAELTRHRDEIAKLVSGMGYEQAVDELYAFVCSHQIRLWFLEWGSCGIALNPMAANCHREAGTASWRNIAPHFGYRDLDVCTGCRNLLVLRRHLTYWSDRYSRLREAWNNLDQDLGSAFKAALLKKLAQAKAMVRSLSKDDIITNGDEEEEIA